MNIYMNIYIYMYDTWTEYDYYVVIMCSSCFKTSVTVVTSLYNMMVVYNCLLFWYCTCKWKDTPL